ncbi:hypothetical protein MJO28_010347 [Puccinia striiformis f. sp. tritici]|uniref:Dynactin subunit 2 n=3 Tax=Puccinia striiformis TaxID=27350 RepID=A0A0L0W2F7_9BASI|nr:hypothetical protein Pst134EA_019147 [Puccinia striiformis f. sp. tritici]KAI9615423.1 hypothetical protein H4Q26_011361 [Puccinia striiformis f. sp. tritici PST-130]KNF05689.1 hypothetical protein PSTG_01092 [Puccinia striiformis f. sp. tritici PST-78]POW02198.1 hypothetical protein PSTT_11922 [Puccinia striiformis]KAH9449241.1 hypothetical protein Pst134EB_020066 [Puccinia striiformis f. sp. tritici]KAH9458995.1 hypothetical protein Pst134EA_019147 [Puccinia striiformis f. sp. tritici]
MSKYASLPDIDTAPDVYETPDLPAIHITERDDDSDNDILPSGSYAQSTKGTTNSDIIKETLDQSLARKKFGAASGLDGSDADFSNSLLRKQPRRSSARYPPPSTRHTFETDEYSMLPRGYAINQGQQGAVEIETPLERLRRLRFEVEQLEEELEHEKVPADSTTPAELDEQTGVGSDTVAKPSVKGKSKAGPTPTDLLVELQHLRQQLEKLSVSSGSSDPLSTTASQLRAREAYAKSLLLQLTERGPKPQEPNLSKPEQPTPPTSRAATSAQLDSRLSVLEELLGSRSLLQASGAGDISLPPPLLVTISKLEHQLSLLTQPRHLDSISRRVKVIVTDLERVHEARRKLTDHRPLSIALASGITVVTQNQAGTSSSSQAPVNTSLGSVPGVISSSNNEPNQVGLPPDALHKLERLYNLLPRLDPLLPLVPHLLSRLRSLSELHSSADQFRNRLNSSVSEIKSISNRSNQVEQTLKILENNLESNQRIITSNLGLVEQRIEKLLESIDSMKSNDNPTST